MSDIIFPLTTQPLPYIIDALRNLDENPFYEKFSGWRAKVIKDHDGIYLVVDGKRMTTFDTISSNIYKMALAALQDSVVKYSMNEGDVLTFTIVHSDYPLHKIYPRAAYIIFDGVLNGENVDFLNRSPCIKEYVVDLLYPNETLDGYVTDEYSGVFNICGPQDRLAYKAFHGLKHSLNYLDIELDISDKTGKPYTVADSFENCYHNPILANYAIIHQVLMKERVMDKTDTVCEYLSRFASSAGGLAGMHGVYVTGEYPFSISVDDAYFHSRLNPHKYPVNIEITNIKNRLYGNIFKSTPSRFSLDDLESFLHTDRDWLSVFVQDSLNNIKHIKADETAYWYISYDDKKQNISWEQRCKTDFVVQLNRLNDALASGNLHQVHELLTTGVFREN